MKNSRDLQKALDEAEKKADAKLNQFKANSKVAANKRKALR